MTKEHTKYEHLKVSIFDAMKQLLAEYFDEKYADICPTDTYSFKNTEMIDLLMLPLLSDYQSFTLNSFLNIRFENDDERALEFKKYLNKICIYDDMVELLMVLKTSVFAEVFNDNDCIKSQLSVSYFAQLKKLDTLLINCRNLIHEVHELKTNSFNLVQGIQIGNAVKTIESIDGKICLMQAQTNSKKALVACIDIINQTYARYYV